MAKPESAASPEPESQPAPDPAGTFSSGLKDAALRDKEAKGEQARADRFLARLAKEWPEKWAAAKALSVSRGR